jgi:N-acetyltransferase
VVNPAAKHLLLGNAFACGANRVQFGVDALNVRSRAAMTKLGAIERAFFAAPGQPERDIYLAG